MTTFKICQMMSYKEINLSLSNFVINTDKYII